LYLLSHSAINKTSKEIRMKNKDLRINLIIASFIVIGIVIGFITRLFVGIPNFTAMGAIALFGGAYLSNKKLAIIIPLMVLFITDLFIGLHNTMIFVYIPFTLIILMGIYLRKNKKPILIFGASILGSVLFYLISNLGVWITGMGYSPILTQVYIDGIPFFRNMLAGDLAFNAVFFTSAYFIFEKTTAIATVNE